MNKIEQEFIERQKTICRKCNTEFLASPFNKLIGVALESLKKFDMPIHGLRYAIESDRSSNWYIWAGQYSEADDFFQPVHVSHLLELCSKANKAV